MITEIQREMPQRQPTGILLIEDDGQERYAVLDCLGEAQADSKDFAVRVAGRLDTGLECLAHGGVDAVLLDLFLPDSSGLETFLQVHSHCPHVPIVILAGVEDEDLATRAVRVGAHEYLRKENLSAVALIRTLRRAAERKQADGVARAFNNLLTVILANAAVLQDCEFRDEVVPRAIKRITQAARSAACLSEQLSRCPNCTNCTPDSLSAGQVEMNRGDKGLGADTTNSLPKVHSSPDRSAYPPAETEAARNS